MGKQKVVLKLTMEDAKKRSKALKTVVGLAGVTSASLEQEKGQIVVVGDGIDAVTLTKMLRRRMGYADLISLAAVEEKKQEKKEEKKETKEEETLILPYAYSVQPPYYYEIHQPSYDPCSIM